MTSNPVRVAATFQGFSNRPSLDSSINASRDADEQGALTSGHHISLWTDQTPPERKYPSLSRDMATDVVVVGGGITGLSTAYELIQAGKKVIVMEDGLIGSGETGRTSAHLANGLDDRYYSLQSMFGSHGARKAFDSHMEAINRIEEICQRENIQCDFKRVPGYLFHHTPRGREGYSEDSIQKEFKTLEGLGVTGVDKVDRCPIPGIDSGLGVVFKNQAQFSPTKYINALARIINESEGCHVFTQTKVVETKGGDQAYAKSESGHTVHCQHIVLATNAPIQNRITVIDGLSPERTYVIVARIPKNSVEEALYWDTAEPYHYVRITKDDKAPEYDNKWDLMIIGGEDHHVGEKDINFEQRYDRLYKWAKERWPQLGEVVYKWSGQIEEPIDFLAYIGHNPHDKSNVYIATGDSGNGLTHGVIAGRLLTDYILGRSNPYMSLYNPSRMRPKSLTSFISTNLKNTMQYKDWLKQGDVRDIEDIRPCSGAVMVQGFQHVAVYKDNEGCVHRMSAVCPHMQGLVRWNDDEKTWDCPVHGSRFDKLGTCINGPAKSNLAEMPGQDDQGGGKRELVAQEQIQVAQVSI